MPPTYHINRSPHLRRLLDSKGWRPAAHGATADFALWYPADDEEHPAHLSLFSFNVTGAIDDKARIVSMLSEFGQEGLMPPTWTSLPDYLAHLKASGDDVYCFLKYTHTSSSTGVFFFDRVRMLFDHLSGIEDMEATAIIQQGIRDPLLVDGHKIKIRLYVLVTADWEVYCYRDGLVALHAGKYTDRTDPQASEISHADSACHSLLAMRDLRSTIWDPACHAVSVSLECLREHTRSIDNPGGYHVFGYDFVCDAAARPWLIEVNGFPNLHRQDPPAGPMLQAMAADLYNLVIGPKLAGTRPVCGNFEKLG